MKNRPVHSNPTTTSKCLLTSSEEPAGELSPPIFRLDLFIVFKIIAHNKTRSLASPLTTANLLFCSTSQYAELVSIRTLNDDVGFLVLNKPFNFKVINERLIFPQLVRNVSKVLNRHLLA